MVNPGTTPDEQAYWQREYVGNLARVNNKDEAGQLATAALEVQRRLLRFEKQIDPESESMTVTNE